MWMVKIYNKYKKLLPGNHSRRGVFNFFYWYFAIIAMGFYLLINISTKKERACSIIISKEEAIIEKRFFLLNQFQIVTGTQ